MGKRISVSAGAYLGAAALLTLLPLPLLFPVLAAGAFHELCHLAALRLCGVPVTGFRLGLGGAVLKTGPTDPRQELLSAAAGPAGSLLLWLLRRQYPLLALCGLVQGLYNLLPFYPMDGGRVLRAVCLLVFPRTGGAVFEALEAAAGGVVLGTGIYACFFLNLGPIPVFIGILAAGRADLQKYLANRPFRGYNR